MTLFLRDINSIYRYRFRFTEAAAVVTLGAGVCPTDYEDIEDCLVFIYVLEDAPFQFPEVLPNGTLYFPPCKSYIIITMVVFRENEKVLSWNLDHHLHCCFHCA